MNSIYIHIPFCLKKCLYCDFLSVPYLEDSAHCCIDTIVKEASCIHKDMLFDTLYIGGGTPTVLHKELVDELLKGVFSIARFKKGYEATIEANPETVDSEKLDNLIFRGINRISLGVQSFKDHELFELGRIHSSSKAKEAFNKARKAGFQNINIDLIFGIPGQTLASWIETLSEAVAIGPTHISTYCLTVEFETLLYTKVKQGQTSLTDDEELLQMYEAAINLLESYGFVHYEISNFALPGFACRHNMNYWNRGTYYGLGPSAHSFVKNQRFHNTKDILKYIRDGKVGIFCPEALEVITDKEALHETIFLGLRKSEGINTKNVKKQYGIDFNKRYEEQIAELLEAELIEMTGTHIRLTRKGLFLSNEVFLRLFFEEF